MLTTRRKRLSAPAVLLAASVWPLEASARASATCGATARGPRGAGSVLVPDDEIAAIRGPGEDWLTYSGWYWSSRHSALRQISRVNVGHLALGWIHQLEG